MVVFSSSSERLKSIHRQVRDLETYCNNMPCPDCGGSHHCRILVSPNASWLNVVFAKDISGAPCFGYMDFLYRKIKDLKTRYNIP